LKKRFAFGSAKTANAQTPIPDGIMQQGNPANIMQIAENKQNLWFYI
jgi:hypothetical protein